MANAAGSPENRENIFHLTKTIVLLSFLAIESQDSQHPADDGLRLGDSEQGSHQEINDAISSQHNYSERQRMRNRNR